MVLDPGATRPVEKNRRGHCDRRTDEDSCSGRASAWGRAGAERGPVFAMPVLSLALTLIGWSPEPSVLPRAAPSRRPVGAVGSSIVTTDAVRVKRRAGRQLEAPHRIDLLQAGRARRHRQGGASRADVQAGDLAAAVSSRPKITVLLGRACIRVPQWQLLRANRPPQRTRGDPVVPAGPGSVRRVRQPADGGTRDPVADPRVELRWLGQTAYELPASVVAGIHASLLNALPGRRHTTPPCRGGPRPPGRRADVATSKPDRTPDRGAYETAATMSPSRNAAVAHMAVPVQVHRWPNSPPVDEGLQLDGGCCPGVMSP